MSEEEPNVEHQTIRLLIAAGGGIPDVYLDPAVTAVLERLERMQLTCRHAETEPPRWDLVRHAVRVLCPSDGIHVVTGYQVRAGYGVYRNGDTTDDTVVSDNGPYFLPGQADGRCLMVRDVELAHDDTTEDYTVVRIDDLLVADPFLQVSNTLTGQDGMIHLSDVGEELQALLDPLVEAGIAHQDHNDPLGDTWLSRPKVYHPDSDRYGIYQRPGDERLTCWVDFGAEVEEVDLFGLIALVSQ